MGSRMERNFRFLIPLAFSCTSLSAQIPKPDHVVIVFFENKNYSQVVASPDAPYINSLLDDSCVAIFTQFYSFGHPSQPNYLMFFSGSNQGVKNDNVPAHTPFSSCNLGASL